MKPFKSTTAIVLLLMFSAIYLNGQTYCTPTSTYGTIYGTYIDGVELKSISNIGTGDSSGLFYNNYTALSTVIYKDTTYSLKITGSPYFSNMHYIAWIDYNNDGDFIDADEKLGEVTSTSANQLMSIIFTVSTHAVTKITRLRVLCVWNVTNPDPCSNITYGEIEDYSVQIENANIFRKINTNWDKTHRSAVRWVDFDNDKDLDISISGNKTFFFSNPTGRLYQNDGGDSTSLKTSIPTLMDGDMKWCDYDRDNDMDLIYAGTYIGGTPATARTGIHRLDSIKTGTLYYTTITSGFAPVSSASIDWGDYDNDGDYDIIISGYNNESLVPETWLYLNINGNFEKTDIGLPGTYNGKTAFVDYDLDGDLDVMITGMDFNSNTFTALYENQNTVFVRNITSFINLESSDFDWADINGDGYPDLVITGSNGLNSQTELYINYYGTRKKGFRHETIDIPGSPAGNIGFIDMNNDGYIDILVSGNRNDSIQNYPLFLNDKANNFYPSTFHTDLYYKGTFDIADYDEDNDADFIINGYKPIIMEIVDVKSSLFENEVSVVNNRPKAPTSLVADVNATSVTLSWTKNTDNTTPSISLTYNIYIGTSKKTGNIVSPNAEITTGRRKISGRGYIYNNRWTIKNLAPGKYYWSVQAIDNSNCASTFATEGSFEIKSRFSVKTQNTNPDYYYPLNYFDSDRDKDMDLCVSIDDKIYMVRNDLKDSLNMNDTINLGLQTFSDLENLCLNDYNNDNKVDFSITGLNFGDEDTLTFLYKNNGSNNFQLAKIKNIPKLRYGHSIWADFDNDGWQDIILSGETIDPGINDTTTTKIFKNLKNSNFQQVNHNIPGFVNGSATAGDFDNDYDVDIIVFGKDSAESPNTYLFLNDSNFQFTKIELPGMKYYRHYESFNIQSGDFNKDGQLDIFIAARDSFNNYYAKVFVNDSLTFIDQYLPLRSQSNMSVYWVDYDYDGDLDLYVYLIDYNDVVYLYINNGGIFEEVKFIQGYYTLQNCPFMTANIDKKFGQDFVTSFLDQNVNQYIDNWSEGVTKSSYPKKLRYIQNGPEITLLWNKESNPAFTYNLKVGTTKDSANICSPLSDLSTGYHYIAQSGNAYLSGGWKLLNLPLGKYYWSVQTIDLAYEGGPWAPLDSFIVSEVSAGFSYEADICFGDTVHFTDLSQTSDTLFRWKWNFGDGSTDTIQNPAHYFKSSGTFNVTLIAYTISGDSAIRTQGIIVKPNSVARFSVEPVCFGQTSMFVNTSKVTGITVASWLWDFGNGNISVVQGDASQLYTHTDTINLTITATNGCVSSFKYPAVVAEIPDASISLETGDNTMFCEGDSAVLHLESFNPDFKYTWEKDGVPMKILDKSNITVQYSGNYQLIALNPTASCTDTSNIYTFNVTPVPLDLFIINRSVKDTICAGDSIQLEASGNSDLFAYEWTNQTGGFVDSAQRIMVYNQGIYKVKARFKSYDYYCWSVNSNQISIIVNPAVIQKEITMNGSAINCEADQVTLNINYSTEYSLKWQKDGITITGASGTNYTASVSGKYSAKITSNKGCTNTSANEISLLFYEIPPKPEIQIASGSSSICPDENLTLSVINGSVKYNYQWLRNGDEIFGEEGFTLSGTLTAGDYQLMSYNESCEIKSEKIIISQKTAPAKTFIVSNDGPELFIMSCKNLNADTYQWYKNGEKIPDATRNYYIVGKEEAAYSVEITEPGYECSVRSYDLMIPSLVTITGIDEMAQNPEAFQVYPNPNYGRFTIQFNIPDVNVKNLAIFNISGKVIYFNESQNTGNIYMIEATHLTEGIYLLKIETDKGIINKKIMIKK